MVRQALFFILALSSACGSAPVASDLDLDEPDHKPAKKDPVPTSTRPAKLTCDSQSDFRYEYIPLPPPFAKDMPRGHEHLFFAPGMFERGSAGYWSYVFAFMFDQPVERSVAGHTRLLDSYYKGLVEAVGKGRFDKDQVQTKLAGLGPPGHYYGVVELFDAFGNGDPLRVNIRLYEGPNCLLAVASVQPFDADIWAPLAEATACLPCKPGK